MREGAPIEDDNKAVDKRRPGRPAKSPVRPPLETAAPAAIRPSVRTDSLREAEAYAAQILETRGAQLDDHDEFYVDPSIWPDGWSYEWKRQFVLNQEDPHYQVDLKRKGWREVPVSRHPELMPEGWTGPIMKKGLVLMELPTVLTDRARARHIMESKDVLSNAERQLHETPNNTAPREEFASSKLTGKTGVISRDFVRPAGA